MQGSIGKLLLLLQLMQMQMLVMLLLILVLLLKRIAAQYSIMMKMELQRKELSL